MINYITEASVCLACFYSIYWLFLRGEKLLSINRFYLLATALISLIIPLLSFEISLNLFQQNQSVSQTGFIEGLGARRHLPTETPLVSIGLVYSIGLAIATLLLAIKVIYAKRRIGQNISLKTKPIKITETDGLAAFSFLNTIFIGKDISKNKELKEHIIAHESAHIEGMHSLDLFLFEVLKCVFWFNPFSYLYCKSIRLQHEYIADQHALKMTSPASYQRSLLELTLSQVNSSLISNFNEHPIETRLKMIQKLNSNVMNKLKTLFAVPILALLFIAFACTDTVDPTPDELELIEYEVPRPIQELQALSNPLLHVIDSMRIVEGKAQYGFNFEKNPDSDGNFKVYEILDSDLKKANLILLKSLEETKRQKNETTTVDYHEFALALPIMKKVQKKSLKQNFEVLTEQKVQTKASQKADKVFLINPDGTRKH